MKCYHVDVRKFFPYYSHNLEGNAGTVNQKPVIKTKEKFAALRLPTLTGEDCAKPQFEYRQGKELKQCTFLPSNALIARSLTEPKACSTSTVIRLRAYHLDDPVLVAGVVDSRAKEKKVLVDYGASVEAARTRESLRTLAAAGIELAQTFLCFMGKRLKVNSASSMSKA